MNESKLNKDYQNINKAIIDKVYNIINNGDITNPKYKPIIKELMESVDYNYANSIGEFVASLFGVDRCDMLSKDKTINIVHARSLWWNALYFIMGKSYKEISTISSLEDIVWNYNSVCESINRIGNEINNNYELQNKWDIIKKIIYIGKHEKSGDNNIGGSIKHKVKIYKPKDVDIEVVNC